MEYLLGQRVIYAGEICLTCLPPKGRPAADQWRIWIKRPVGYESCVSIDNVKPLPNGQL